MTTFTCTTALRVCSVNTARIQHTQFIAVPQKRKRKMKLFVTKCKKHVDYFGLKLHSSSCCQLFDGCRSLQVLTPCFGFTFSSVLFSVKGSDQHAKPTKSSGEPRGTWAGAVEEPGWSSAF